MHISTHEKKKKTPTIQNECENWNGSSKYSVEYGKVSNVEAMEREMLCIKC